MKQDHLITLQNAYNERRLVLFIGAGLSVPFNIPTWGELITIIAEEVLDTRCLSIIKQDINNNDYWRAIDNIMNYGNLNEEQLQKKICEIVENKVDHSLKNINNDAHNYDDIANMNVTIYLTTNYDLLIRHFLLKRGKNLASLQVLHEINKNTQLFFNGDDRQYVFHLHGHIKEHKTIVISEKKYDELYSNDKYDRLLGLFQAATVILFIGVSLNDIYLETLLKKNNEYFNSEHFIILDNPTSETEDKLNEYCIWQTKNGSYVLLVKSRNN